MDDPPASGAEIATLERRIDEWLAAEAVGNPAIAGIERDESPDIRRWYVRINGEEKDVYAIWFTLGQRTLHFETYVMPAPEENGEEFYRQLLRRNHHLTGLAFEIGAEDAVFLAGSRPIAQVDDTVLDGILGSVYATVELCFRPALRIGFASRLAGR